MPDPWIFVNNIPSNICTKQYFKAIIVHYCPFSLPSSSLLSSAWIKNRYHDIFQLCSGALYDIVVTLDPHPHHKSHMRSPTQYHLIALLTACIIAKGAQREIRANLRLLDVIFGNCINFLIFECIGLDKSKHVIPEYQKRKKYKARHL